MTVKIEFDPDTDGWAVRDMMLHSVYRRVLAEIVDLAERSLNDGSKRGSWRETGRLIDEVLSGFGLTREQVYEGLRYPTTRADGGAAVDAENVTDEAWTCAQARQITTSTRAGIRRTVAPCRLPREARSRRAAWS